MIGVAARTLKSNAPWRHTIIVHSIAAGGADSTARPRVYDSIGSDWHVAGIEPCINDPTERLMTERDRRIHAALAHVKTLAAAQIEIAVPDVDVAVTYPAILEPEQDLCALRLRRLALYFLQRLAPFNDVIAQHILSCS